MKITESLVIAREHFNDLLDENPIQHLTDYYFDRWSVSVEFELPSAHRVWVTFPLINNKIYRDPLYCAFKCYRDIYLAISSLFLEV